MAPPPELNADAVSEILLHLSPEDRAGLVRASAVCKSWLRTLNDPAFVRSYRDFHGTPRMLGFLHNEYGHRGYARFVTTTAFRPHATAATHRAYCVVDCGHGGVLLYNSSSSTFVIWDPIIGHERRIPADSTDSYSNHAVLCAAGNSCDHSTCSNGGPFLLASARARASKVGGSVACCYSSETGAWSEQTRLSHSNCYSLEDRPAALVGGAVYFDGGEFGELLWYDVLGGRGLLLMELPPGYYLRTIVMTAGNGGLGLATFDDHGTLALWSAAMGTDGDARWSQIKLSNLQEVLPIDFDMSSAWFGGYAEDTNVIFLSTDDGDRIFFNLCTSRKFWPI